MRAWFLDGGKLEALPLSRDSALAHPSLMMVHYNSQYYLQPVEGFQVRGLGGQSGGHGELAIGTTGSQVEEENPQVSRRIDWVWYSGLLLSLSLSVDVCETVLTREHEEFIR